MINRAAILLKYKAPAVQWINDTDPHDDQPEISIETVNHESTVYLIQHQDTEPPNPVDDWIGNNYDELFENELEGWYTIESLWPVNRDLALFHKWFDIECYTVIEDTVGTPIFDYEV